MDPEIKELFYNINKVIINSSDLQNDGILSGNCGLVLYLIYASHLSDDQNLNEKATLLLDNVLVRFQNGQSSFMGYSLASGITGLGILLTILVDDELIDFDLSDLDSIDDYIFTKSMEDIKSKNIDFLHQSMGAVYYFTLRSTDTKISSYLEILVEEICANSIQDDLGFRYLNSFGHQPFSNVNFGLAHGMCGILLTLLRVYNLGIKQNLIKPVILDGIKFILRFSSNVNDSSYSPYPLSVSKDDFNFQPSTMMAWCYGDLDILYLLNMAAITLNTDEFDKDILQIKMNVCFRNFNDSLVKDSHFCHGASGVCYFFKYLYDLTNDQDYYHAYQTWFSKTMMLLKNDLENNVFKNNSAGLLEGLAGVGLVLISNLTDQKFSWSKVFLL